MVEKFKILFFIALLFTLDSCKKDYLYDRTGFEAGTVPTQVPTNPNAPVKVAPDYYHRQAQYGYPPQQQPDPAYYQQQPYPPQAYQQAPQPYPRGGSRYYSNPYAIPPSSQYPNYDADQYYVPPAYYNNVEPQPQQQHNALKQAPQMAY